MSVNPVIDRNELLKNLQEMIRIDSVNPSLFPGGCGEAEITRYIGQCLNQLGLKVKYQEAGTDRVNVIGILKGAGEGRSIMLNGHTDTVSAEGMEINPLDPRYQEDRVYGRGSLDMKGGLAAMIAAVKAIVQSGAKLKGDVILAFVTDEEYASIGTEALVREYSADAAIIPEPTGLEIGIAHKGFAWMRVEVFGKAAHGSRPNEGIDAIVKAGKVLAGIELLGSKILARKNHELLGAPSIHASLISGGTELSTYPSYCRVELERRTIPGEDYHTVVDEMNRLLQKIKSEDHQFRAAFDVFLYRPPLEIAKDQLIVKTLAEAYKKRIKKPPVYTGFTGWMDSAILAGAGIPTVIFGPGGKGLHASVEYVEFDSVVTTAEVLAGTIIDFCGVDRG